MKRLIRHDSMAFSLDVPQYQKLVPIDLKQKEVHRHRPQRHQLMQVTNVKKK